MTHRRASKTPKSMPYGRQCNVMMPTFSNRFKLRLSVSSALVALLRYMRIICGNTLYALTHLSRITARLSRSSTPSRPRLVGLKLSPVSLNQTAPSQKEICGNCCTPAECARQRSYIIVSTNADIRVALLIWDTLATRAHDISRDAPQQKVPEFGEIESLLKLLTWLVDTFQVVIVHFTVEVTGFDTLISLMNGSATKDICEMSTR